MTSSNANTRTAREIFDHAKTVSLKNIKVLGRVRDQAPTPEIHALFSATLAEAIDIYFQILDDEER
jgi:hypothetical protein